MTGKEDPLRSLLLDADEVDKARLAQGLQGILGVDSNDGRLVLRPGFNDLDATGKVLAYLLGALAARLLTLRASESVAPTEIQRETGLPKGTVNPKLSELFKARKVSKTKAGSYFVVPHQVDPAIKSIRSKGRTEEGSSL